MNSFYSKTFILCCFVAVIDRADQMLLPAVYFEVSKSLNLGPLMLATISAVRGVTESLSALISGPLGETYDRIHLIAFGCIIWAASTAAVGASTSLTSLIISRMFNGLGLGFVTPPVFGIVSDLFVEEKRGRAFGIIGTSSNLGAALGSMLATSVAGSVDNGWRVAFYLIATTASILTVMILLFGEEPRRQTTVQHVVLNQSEVSTSTSKAGEIGLGRNGNEKSTVWNVWNDMSQILKLKTFWTLMVQGIFFEIPWYAMNFFTMWLELSGWSHMMSASIRLCFDIGMTFGVLIGGKLSDVSNIWNKDKGRIAVSQFSVGIGIPLWILILKVKYAHSNNGCFQLSLLVLLTGLLTQYGFPCKAAMLAEIAPTNGRTLIYALMRAGEGTLAAVTSPIVGVLAEQVFQFKLEPPGSESDDDSDDGGSGDGRDSKALSRAMVLSMTVPWALSVLVLCSAYYTYPKDRTKTQTEKDEQEVVEEVELSVVDIDRVRREEVSTHISEAPSTFNPFHSTGHEI